MSSLLLSQGLLYIRSCIHFWQCVLFCFVFFLNQTCICPSSYSLASHGHWAEVGWHLPDNPSLCQGAGIWCSSPPFQSVLADPFFFCLPLPLLILSFYFQPAFEYNTEEPCAVNTDTHPWVYLHIHTFISFWNKQDQRRKVRQTPLRCWAWLCRSEHRRPHTR